MSLFGRRNNRIRRSRSTNNREVPSSSTTTTKTTTPDNNNILWEVYVDQSKQSLDRGGSATLDAFLGLAPQDSVKVVASTFSSTSTTSTATSTATTTTNGVVPKGAGSTSSSSSSTANGSGSVNGSSISTTTSNGNGSNSGKKPTTSTSTTKLGGYPFVRCISTDGSKCFDVTNVDGVDKVYRILTRHMQCKNIDYDICECLKWKYKGNAHLEAGKFDEAVDSYNNALQKIQQSQQSQSQSLTTTSTSIQQQEQQEGILLLMRATAYLQRASSHKSQLKQIVRNLMKMVPDATRLKNLYEQTQLIGCVGINHSMFRRVLADSSQQEEMFRRTQYWHGLYQYALLQAARDALRATQLLPTYSRGWARAGEILSELWKLSESAQYYETAIKCDPNLQDKLVPVIERLRKRQDLLESARAYGWSEDTLRLALDVAG